MTGRENAGSVSSTRGREAGRVVIAGLIAAILVAGILAFFLSRDGGKRKDAGPGEPGGPPAASAPGAVEPEPPPPAPPVPPAPPDAGSKEAGTAEEAPAGQKADGPKGSVGGTVRIAGTEEAAPGVIVVVRVGKPGGGDEDFQKRFMRPRVEEGDRSAPSGPDGRYRIEDLAPGDYRLFALSGETSFVSIPPSMGKPFSIAADALSQEIDIEVVRGGTIHGKVMDVEEAPIAGAGVSAPDRDMLAAVFDPDSPFQGVAEVMTKEDGTYRIAGLPLDGKYSVLAQKDGMRAGPEDVEFGGDEPVLDVALDFVLLPGNAIAGRVVGADGAPAPAGTSVHLYVDARDIFSFQPGREIKIDAAGEFRFEKVQAGVYNLYAGSGDRKEGSGTNLECDGKTDVTGLVLKLVAAGPEGKALSGRVVDDAGSPVPGVHVSLGGFSPGKGAQQFDATSGDDGSFNLGHVPQGAFNLTVNHDKHAPYTKPGVSPDSGPLEIVLQRAATVRGTVVARTDGSPIAGAIVRLDPLSGDGGIARLMAGQVPGALPSAKTSDDGAFVLEKVPPGRARLRAEANRLAPGLSKEIEMAPASDTGDVTIALSRGGTLSGVVLGPDGKPIADAVVRASDAVGNTFEDSIRRIMPAMLGAAGTKDTSDESGAFRIRYLQEGKFILAASHPDFAPSAEREVTLPLDGKIDRIELRLRAPGSIRVRVREKEAPLTGLMVQAIGEGPMKMLSTDAEGKAEFVNLGPGDYMIQVIELAKMMAGQGMGMRQRTVRVEEGRATDLEIVFGVGAKVNGKVTGKLPQPMGMVVISRKDGPKSEEIDARDLKESIRASAYNVSMGMINPDGTFSVPDVPDGEFLLEVPRIPTDYAKYAQMTPEERKPYFRGPVKVEGGRDVQFPSIHLRDEGEPAPPPGEEGKGAEAPAPAPAPPAPSEG
jgi:hypothetical protein